MTTQATIQRDGTDGSPRSAVLLALALGAILTALIALVVGSAQQAEAAFPGSNARITFASARTTGTGVNNPTGDQEIFTIKPDGTGLKQLTFNTYDDISPVFSPDGSKIAYDSQGDSTSNPEGDYEIYIMNASDGSGQKNLTNNGANVDDYSSEFSPDGTKIVYGSEGIQPSNPQGDYEVYVMSASDGTGKKNLSNNGGVVDDYSPNFSHGGKRIAYTSYGKQTSNSQGDTEVYVMNALDGLGKKNLTNNGARDYNPDWGRQAN